MTGRYLVIVLAGILLSSGILSIDLHLATGGSTRLDVDPPSYRLATLEMNLTTMEDEVYRARFYATMSNLTLNAFVTDADWLSWEYSEPPDMDMTGARASWDFDLGDARDSSGNGNDGTLSGPTVDIGVSPAGGSMYFDGSDHISIPHSNSLNITDEITVEAWIFPTFTNSGEHMILSKGGNWNTEDPQCYELTMDQDRPLFQMKLPNTEDWYGAAPLKPITKNRWHHVAGVYDGNLFYIYIDGINQTSIFNGWSGDYKGAVYKGGLPTGDFNVSIGRREPATWGSIFFEGRIDDVKVWDRAIPPDELMTHATIPGERCLDIYGIPDNGDVGDHDVLVNVTDNEGKFAFKEFTITVENALPSILTVDVEVAYQDQEYSVQYVSDEEDGDIQWYIDTEAMWLSMDRLTGILSGTPRNDDVGIVSVKVEVNDGNGGKTSRSFDLEVLDVNDPPAILSENVMTATEDEYYYVEYHAMDIDGEALEWDMATDADWLSMDTYLGVLNGTPTNDDVGTFDVNITVTDPRGMTAWTSFDLEVVNVNDPPVWTDVPENGTVSEGSNFIFDFDAIDIDVGDVLVYDISIYPESEFDFDPDSGEFLWYSNRSIFSEGNYSLRIKVEATDGIETIDFRFHLDLILNPSPTSTLLSPDNDTKVTNVTVLEWAGYDEEEAFLTYDVYMGRSVQEVLSMSDALRIATGIEGTEIEVRDLEEGATYYWTVIPRDHYSSGTCLDQVHSFYVDIPPIVDLLTPGDGAKVAFGDVVLTFRGTDPDDEDLSYSIYIATEAERYMFPTPSLIETGPSPYTFSDAVPGTVYYWTVIPSDGILSGTCRNGLWSFIVNTPPVLVPVDERSVHAGSELTVQVNGSDADGDELVFTLLEAPYGMTVVPNTGIIKWVPMDDDVGLYTIKVQLTDGIDTVNMTFRVNVGEAPIKEVDEADTPVWLFILIGIVILIIVVGIVLFFFLRKGKGEEAVEEPPAEEVAPMYLLGENETAPSLEEEPEDGLGQLIPDEVQLESGEGIGAQDEAIPPEEPPKATSEEPPAIPSEGAVEPVKDPIGDPQSIQPG